MVVSVDACFNILNSHKVTPSSYSTTSGNSIQIFRKFIWPNQNIFPIDRILPSIKHFLSSPRQVVPDSFRRFVPTGIKIPLHPQGMSALLFNGYRTDLQVMSNSIPGGKDQKHYSRLLSRRSTSNCAAGNISRIRFGTNSSVQVCRSDYQSRHRFLNKHFVG